MSFGTFFEDATGFPPYPYQSALAERDWPERLHVPSGLGKSAAVTLAWLYHRCGGDRAMPRQLFWCLPRRAFLEPLQKEMEGWLQRLALQGDIGEGACPSVFRGDIPRGRIRAQRAHGAGRATIVLATRDALLGRGLPRRARGGDEVLRIYDEPALMRTAGASDTRSLSLSADTWSNGGGEPQPVVASLTDADRNERTVARRFTAAKHLREATTRLERQGNRQSADVYIQELAEEVARLHAPWQRTIVVLNRVARAEGLFHALGQRLGGTKRLLLHERLPQEERYDIANALRLPLDPLGCVLVATQAVEAAVDVSSRVLFTELAPWPALVQRFGRCNRAGEHADAQIRWIDIEGDGCEAAPYFPNALDLSRRRLLALDDAASVNLMAL